MKNEHSLDAPTQPTAGKNIKAVSDAQQPEPTTEQPSAGRNDKKPIKENFTLTGIKKEHSGKRYQRHRNAQTQTT